MNITSVKSSKYRTNDYSIFELIIGNRPIELNTPKRKKVYSSLKKNGWFEYEPAITCKHGNKYFVIDGQHRVRMAIELGILIVFEVVNISLEEAKEIMVELQNGTPWGMFDYINKYAQEGNEEYLYVQSFAKTNSIPIVTAANILFGQLPYSNNSHFKIKDGSFKIKNMDYANKVVSIKRVFSDFDTIKNKSELLVACGKLALVDRLDLDRLSKKAKSHSCLVKNYHSCSDYLQMVEDIYNRHSNNKLPIKFLADQASATRNVARKR
jgi:hypothetical protein